jgi:hypothetical protein
MPVDVPILWLTEMVAAPISVAGSPLAITTLGPFHGRKTYWDSCRSSGNITVSAAPVSTTPITHLLPLVRDFFSDQLAKIQFQDW